jgi:uncharacterized RDD family membrane protein YckC
MTDEGRYAGVVSRGVAFVADALIVVVVSVGCLAGIQLISSVLAGTWSRVLSGASGPLLFLGPAGLLVLYNASFWWLTGRTPGMALLGLRVLRSGGRPVGWPRAVVRALAFAFLGWGILWSLVDRRRQALHDKLAGTVVVYDAAFSAGDRASPETGMPAGAPGRSG